jgi:hypothetical protein
MTKPASFCSLVIATLALLAPVPDVWAQDKTKPLKKETPPAKKPAGKTEPIQEMQINDALTGSLSKDNVRRDCYHKVHTFRMVKGSTYTIDMASRDFDAFLRLEDSKGKQLAFDDDSGGGQNARIVFTAPETDDYRIIATTFGAGQQGRYTLTAKHGRQPLSTPGGPVIAGAGMAPQPVAYGDLAITLEPPLIPMSPHGYAEYRVTVKNASQNGHQVQIVIPQSPASYGIHLRSLSRTVEVGPASRVAFSLFQPDINMPGNGVQVVIDGRPQRELLPIGQQRGQFLQYFGGGGFSYQATVLVSAGQAVNGVQFQWGRGGFVPPPPRTGHMAAYQFPLARPDADTWSKSWLGYSGYDGVVVNSSELATLPPEAESALRQYVECGGSLTVVGPWKAPKTWERTRSTVQGLTRFYPGFGQCFNVAEPNVGKWTNEQMKLVTTSWQHSGEPWLELLTPTEANGRFPVVEHLNVPVRGMFVLMLAFSVVIGPVNLYILGRMKRRLWLLWTVPVISLLTCLAVLGYMFAAEGWEGHVRSETFTVLDETSHQASTLGWIGFYTPVVPSDGLHFSPQTELTAQIRSSGYIARSHALTLDWTEDQHLASGWLTARVPAHFVVRKSERRLERVTVSKGKDGTLTMVNGLKEDIREIRVMGTHPTDLTVHQEASKADKRESRDIGIKGGKVYAASNVPAGQQAVLRPVGVLGSPEVDVLRKVYRGRWLEGIRNAGERPELLLRPGCYVAILDATPFLEDGLTRPGHRKGHSVVYGVMKAPIEE